MANRKETLKITEMIKCAESGSANSQNDLAGYYFSKGIYDEAFFWVKKAAEQGFPFAVANLGKMYKDGIGVQRNIQAAINLFADSIGFGLTVPVEELNINDLIAYAEQGNANAQLLLGICYGDGINVESNICESVHWYYKAAEQEQPLALLIIGTFLLKGEKIPRNILSAEMYLSAAIRQGASKAKGVLSDLYSKIAKEVPYYLVKVTGKIWAEKFLDGEVFMRTVASFCNEGFINQYRGDIMEGFSHSFGDGHNPYGYSIDSNGIHEIGEGFIIQDGVMDMLLQREKIFCLYCLDYDEKRRRFISPDPRLRDFGDTVVVILDPQEFLHRVMKAIDERFNDISYWVSYKRVSYDVDVSVNKIYSEFHKTPEYSYQREFRIAVDLTEGRFDKETLQNVTDYAKLTFPGRLEEDTYPDSIADSMTIKIGSIRDICDLYSIDEFLKNLGGSEATFAPPPYIRTLDTPRSQRPTFFKPIGHMAIK